MAILCVEFSTYNKQISSYFIWRQWKIINLLNYYLAETVRSPPAEIPMQASTSKANLKLAECDMDLTFTVD